MKRLTSLLFFILSLLTVSAATTNNQYNGTFHGNFYDINGNPISGGITPAQATAAAQAVSATNVSLGSLVSSILTPTNAIWFCQSNGIYDPFMERKLVEFQDVFLASPYATNFVDALLFSSDYNPKKTNSFMGRKIQGTRLVQTKYTLDGMVTNGAAPGVVVSLAIPSMTNGSVFVVYAYTNPVMVNLILPVVGFANDLSGSNSWWLARSPQSETFIQSYSNGVPTWGLGGNLNAIVDNPSGPNSAGIGQYDSDYYASYYNIQEAFSWNTNGTINEFRYGQQDILGFNGITPTVLNPTIAMTASDMNYVLIGKDPVGTWGTEGTNSMFNIKEVFVFNTPMTASLYSNCVQAAQWLERSKDIVVLVGDSRMCSSGTTPIVLGPTYYYNLWCRQNNKLFYDFSYPGQSLLSWNYTGPPTGYSRVQNFIGPYINHGNVNSIKVIWALGVNDGGVNQASAITMWQYTSNLVSILPQGVLPYVATVYPFATNSYVTNVWPAWTGQSLAGFETNRTIFNAMIFSNAWDMAGIVDLSSYFTSDDLKTNIVPQLSIDGVHFNGSNNIPGIQRVAQILEGNPPIYFNSGGVLTNIDFP